MAMGAGLVGGVAGLQVNTAVQMPTDGDGEIPWNDGEEQRYREWLRDTIQDRPEANFNEYQAEADYRERMRLQMEARVDEPISWDDEVEREHRRRYVEMRRQQMKEEADWQEYQAEQEHRDRIRRLQDAKKNQKVVWDDAEERKCQERYRKKYSTS